MNEPKSDAGTGMGTETRFDPVMRDSEGKLYLLPDVHTAAESAVTGSGESNISDNAVLAASDHGISIGGEIVAQGDIVGGDKHVFMSYDTAFERVIGSTAFVLNQLETIYKETREQSRSWFRLSLIAAGVGFVVIGIGILAVMLGQLTAGVITAISSIVPNAAAALFFVQSKSANERVDAIQSRLTDARELQTAVEITNTIGDPKSRDRLKAEIVRKALRIEKKTDEKGDI